MSINIPTHFVPQFSSNIALLLQQRGSKLRGLVTVGNYVGKQASPVDQVAQISALKVTNRFAPMGRVDAALDRRWVFPVDYDLPQLIDSFDKLRLITDPSSTYVQNAMYAMGRAMDDEIVTALFGDAKTGEAGATTTVHDTTGQRVAEGGTGLTVAKLRAAKKILMKNEVDLDSDPLTCIITAAQHDNLLSDTNIISTDFNEKPVLVDGKVTRFLGINFVHCERIPLLDADTRRVPIFPKSAMHLGIWDDIGVSVSKRHDLQGEPWQAYCTGTFGATRIEEKRMVEVLCLEA